MSAPFGRRAVEVVEARSSGSYELLTVADPAGPKPRAGQFYMLASERHWGEDGERPYLPRAFSFAACEPLDGGGVALGFLLEAVGPGTSRLSRVVAGERLQIVGPLGIPFSVPGRLAGGASEALLVGGGIGTAPLAVLDHELQADGASVRVLLGFRGPAHAGGMDLFATEPQVVSEDGQIGGRGLVTDLLEPLLDRDGIAVYSCGPPAMLEAVRSLCAERGAPCELAMESGMACGFGACFGCVVPTKTGFRRLCVDGPVVNAADLDSALVPGAGH